MATKNYGLFSFVSITTNIEYKQEEWVEPQR